MAKEEIGLSGEHLRSACADIFHILNNILPAVLVAQIYHRASLHAGQAMTQMVIGHHNIAVFAQIRGKRLIARAILSHTVRDLNNTADLLSQRGPLVHMDQRFMISRSKVIFRTN